MKIKGKCDFCERDFANTGGIYNVRANIVDRPQGWAGMFVWNSERMPDGATFHPRELEKFGVETKTVCTFCLREPEDLEKALAAEAKVVKAKAKVKPVKVQEPPEEKDESKEAAE